MHQKSKTELRQFHKTPQNQKIRELFDSCLKGRWWLDEVLSKYVETTLHSEHIQSVLPLWMAHSFHGLKKPKEIHDKRTEVCQKLLSITPSAIRLKFVWRHLVTYRQDLLNPYLKAQAFAGPFDEPGDDGSGGRGGGGRRGGGRRGGGRRPVPRRRERSGGSEEDYGEEEGEAVEEENLWIIPACYGLRRLLPSQASTLGSSWLAVLHNRNKPISERVQAVIRWTLMPTTDYSSIVNLASDEEVPISLGEALLKGTMTCDDPCIPLGFLLQPKFVTSDRARVSAYAVSSCIPFMKPGGLASIALRLLKEPELRVTAHKQLVRLLKSEPSKEHMDILFKDWENIKNHIDVKFTILESALKLLSIKNEYAVATAWKIIESAAKGSNNFALALLGVRPGAAHKPDPIEASYFKSTTVTKAFKKFSSNTNAKKGLKIPLRHCAQYASTVVLYLATSSKENDVKLCAIALLWGWKVITEGAPILSNVLVTADLKTPASFWERCCKDLLNMSGVTRKNVRLTSASPETFVLPILTTGCTRLLEISADKALDGNKRLLRMYLFERLKTFLGSLPLKSAKYYADTLEQEFMKTISQPALKNVFWQYQTQRYLDQTVVDDKFAKAALVHFQRLVSFVVQFRSHKQFAINAFNSHVMAAHNGCADKAQKANYVFPILEALIAMTPTEPVELSILDSVLFQFLPNIPRFSKIHIDKVLAWITIKRANSKNGAELRTLVQTLTKSLNPIRSYKHQAGSFLKLTDSGKKLVKFIIDSWSLGSGTPEEKGVIRDLAMSLITSCSDITLKTYPDFLFQFVHFLISDFASLPGDHDHSEEVVKYIKSLLAKQTGLEITYDVIESILLLKLTSDKVTQQYSKLSLDVGFQLVANYPKTIVSKSNLIPVTVNWYTYHALKDQSTWDSQSSQLRTILCSSGSKEKTLGPVLAALLTGEYIDQEKQAVLKNFLEPLRSQYINFGSFIVLSVLKGTKEVDFTPEYIALLDSLCSSEDPAVSVAAWEITGQKSENNLAESHGRPQAPRSQRQQGRQHGRQEGRQSGRHVPQRQQWGEEWGEEWGASGSNANWGSYGGDGPDY